MPRINGVKKLDYWHYRTQKVQLFVCIFAAVSVQCAVSQESPVVVHQVYAESAPEATNEECETPGCLAAASKVKIYIDESIDPCTNFYDFACGNFIKSQVVPDDKVTVDGFSTVRDIVEEQIRTVINEPIQRNESKPFRLAKYFNQACLNEANIEERGIQPMIAILETLGGWPAVKGNLWDEENFSWIETIKKFRRIGISVDFIFSFSVETDLKNTSARHINIDQTNNEFEREYLVKGLEYEAVKAYYSYMVENAVIFGANRARAEAELKDALEFEIKLANISLPKEERRNATALYNLYTIKQLQESYPYLNWLDYINALLPTGLDVTENEVLNNVVPRFYEQLEGVLNSTPKRTIANYLLWRAVFATSGSLNKQMLKLKLDFYRSVYGLIAEQPRWKECIQITSSKLGISVGALYVRKFFKEESRQAAISLVEDVRSVFSDILHVVPWMDETTRTEAIKKAKLLTTHIGYPNELTDNNKLEEYYSDLEMEPDDFLLDSLRWWAFETDRIFKKLRDPVNKTDWETHSIPTTVGAFYTGRENGIKFPAAILQDRFFAADRPQYMNYASIGSIIGHEITHGFDDQGRQFDFDGNLVDWWAPETQKQFLEKAECIIWQYGNYTDLKTNLSLSGINTQGENIADNGGVKEAYYAYNNWMQRNAPEGLLKDVKYNRQQLFWISHAQMRCSVSRDNFYKNQIITGVHAPNEFRINGVLSNMPEFAYDFNCPVGTKMNPEKKCGVW